MISPTLIDDVSRAVDSLIHQNKRGIYHVSCKTPTTPFDFGYHLVSVFFSSDEAEKNLKKGSIIEFNKIPGKAKRPVHGGLKMDKIQNEGFTVKTYQQGIDAILKQMGNSSGKI